MISAIIVQKFLDTQLRMVMWSLLSDYPGLYSPEGIRLCAETGDRALLEEKGEAVDSISSKLITLEKCASKGPEQAFFGKILDTSSRGLLECPIPGDISGLAADAWRLALAGKREEAVELIEQRLKSLEEASNSFLSAELMLILGRLYRACPTGDIAAHKEKALLLYSEAENVFSRDKFPRDWAALRHYSANVFLVRSKGTKAANIERAIELNEEVLDVFSLDTFPKEYADVCHNLAAVYIYRIMGDHAENLERAIDLFERALVILTEKAFPQRWSQILSMLAGAYHSRLEGSREKNEERAIELYRSALGCTGSGLSPVVRARIKNNMALSWMNRISGGKARNLENAIKLHKDALLTFTRDEYPQEWAETCKNLANTYGARKHGAALENVSMAVTLYEDALTVMTRDRSPDGWAKTCYALGNVLFRKWELDGETGALWKAKGFYEASLSVWQPDTFPGSCVQSAVALAETAAHVQDWKCVEETASIAREADRTLQLSSITLSGRSDNIEISAGLYYFASLAAMRQDDPAGAVEWLEQGKTRELKESLAWDRAIFEHRLTPEDAAEYRKLLALLRKSEAGERLGSLSGKAFTVAVEKTRRVRKKFENVLSRIRRYEPSFLADLKLDEPRLGTLLTRPGRAYVLFNVTSTGTVVIVLHGTASAPRFSGFFERSFTISDLHRLNAGWLEQVGRAEKGENRTRAGRKSWARRLHELGRELHDGLFQQVHEWLRESGPDISSLVLVPHLGLHSLPLQLMRYDIDGGARFLMDDYEIGFAPSLSLLLRLGCSKDEGLVSGKEQLDLLAVANPTGDLDWSAEEAETIAGLFSGPCKVLSGAEATPEAFFAAAPRAGVLHLCCHGVFDREDPWKSSLILADEHTEKGNGAGRRGKNISLNEIISVISFSRSRLVVLSACETGLVDTNGMSDEFVGLPGGFLRAGAACVVASMWSVDDRATAALMTHFYHGIAVEGRPPAEALKQAQLRLRTNRQWRSPYFWGAFRVLGICS